MERYCTQVDSQLQDTSFVWAALLRSEEMSQQSLKPTNKSPLSGGRRGRVSELRVHTHRPQAHVSGSRVFLLFVYRDARQLVGLGPEPSEAGSGVKHYDLKDMERCNCAVSV